MSAPSVSIGLPVYNGERYVRTAIESILNQTLQDWELIICDNASTDGTQAICEDYAARDARLRYLRNPSNIGAANNYRRVVELAQGRYFKWIASDDYCAPEFLDRCQRANDCVASAGQLVHRRVRFGAHGGAAAHGGDGKLYGLGRRFPGRDQSLRTFR